MSLTLCDLADIPDGEGRGFQLDQGVADAVVRGVRDIFVVRRGPAVFAYANACPHAGTPLDWVENQFMTYDKSHILCATHGALFRVEDGRCILGPCEGDALQELPVCIRDGAVVLG